MTTTEIKAFLATPKGKLIAACSALVLCWIILLPILFGDFFKTGASGARGELELKKARNACAAAEAQKREADALRARYRRMIDGAWREERDGMIEVGMRRLVGDAADSVENFKLQNLGSVRNSRINHELYCGEVDVTASDTLDKIVAFLAAIQKVSPELNWRRLELRPDYRAQWMRSRQNNTVNLAQLPEPQATQIYLSGSLRMLGYDGKSAAPTGAVKAGQGREKAAAPAVSGKTPATTEKEKTPAASGPTPATPEKTPAVSGTALASAPSSTAGSKVPSAAGAKEEKR